MGRKSKKETAQVEETKAETIEESSDSHSEQEEQENGPTVTDWNNEVEQDAGSNEDQPRKKSVTDFSPEDIKQFMDQTVSDLDLEDHLKVVLQKARDQKNITIVVALERVLKQINREPIPRNRNNRPKNFGNNRRYYDSQPGGYYQKNRGTGYGAGYGTGYGAGYGQDNGPDHGPVRGPNRGRGYNPNYDPRDNYSPRSSPKSNPRSTSYNGFSGPDTYRGKNVRTNKNKPKRNMNPEEYP